MLDGLGRQSMKRRSWFVGMVGVALAAAVVVAGPAVARSGHPPSAHTGKVRTEAFD
jgi:hypothetical protein